MDDKIREKYLKMDNIEKTNFQKILENIFLNKLKVDELKNVGISLSKKIGNIYRLILLLL